MLAELQLHNFAIAADVTLRLGAGLNVVTGETGAGKSILVDALSLILGGRSAERVVRSGAEAAELQALFVDVQDPECLAAAEERGISLEDGALIVRRVVARDGKRRAWLNGRMATGADLRAVVGPLVDLSTQHQQNRLLDRRNHLAILDRAADTGAELAAYRTAYAALRAAQSERDALAQRLQQAAERRDYLRFCEAELDEAAIEAGETEALEAEVRRLRAAESLLQTAARAAEALTGDGGARDALSGLPRELERTRRDDAGLADFSGRIEDILALCDDLAADLERYAERVQLDPQRLGEAEARLSLILGLCRKYGGSEDALLQRQQAIAEELAAETTGERRLEELERGLPPLRRAAVQAADALSQARRAAADRLAAEVESVIAGLGMERARFFCRFAEVDAGAGEANSATDGLGPDGRDRVTFELQGNPGEPAQDLTQVASGGELSRVLLGLERAAARVGSAPTAIYDEIDAGLSGSTGIALGRFLAEIAAGQQLVVVSHLPQVAAAADHHLHVRKEVREDASEARTESAVDHLEVDGRVRELARMLGTADAASATALQHARALLEQQQRRQHA
ncbi:MAG: DNA repair protein RecN [Deltaproteobacteria bacterium]|nr:DNA repair protein RecN [Deltaproteobacteria bacterium]